MSGAARRARPDSVPSVTPGARNALSLEAELGWFGQVLDTRFRLYFEQECAHDSIDEITPPDLAADQSEYARLVKACAMSFEERLVLVLALIPHIRPQLLDTLFMKNKNFDRGFTELGGWHGKTHGGFLPTCETAAFVLAGSDLVRRFELIRLFEPQHFFHARNILGVEHRAPGEPVFSAALTVSSEYLNRLTCGVHHKPDYSTGFPAKLITTPLGWDDLVLPPEVAAEVENINTWIAHADTIMQEWGLARSLKPGYRSLFYGPPGTGKTLTATLIGASVSMDVYRIDLSMVVSKYIGETEKNLANVFDQAQNKHWLLFFDEADALFGKRTTTSNSNDRHANQEISYLLQRVEDFPGVVILATNLKANIDDAFARRFQSLVHFPMPDADERQRLWEGILNGGSRLGDDVDLRELAEQYELSGGAITNVVRCGAISALQGRREHIQRQDLIVGITKELRKEGRTP